MKVIDNLLDEKDLDSIQSMFMREDATRLPWYFNNYVAQNVSDDPCYYFTHHFLINNDKSDWFHLLQPLFKMLKPVGDVKHFIRIKGNMYPSTPKIVYHDPHVDIPWQHKGAIFYVNTNNGVTVLEDGTEIESIENRLLLFDSSKKHNSTSCTDAKVRVNINFNYF